MVTGGFVDYVPEGRTYSLSPDHAPFLTGTTPDNLARVMRYLPLLGQVTPQARATRSTCSRTYPQSTFTGYDFSEAALVPARAEAADWGLTNARFEVLDVARLDANVRTGPT